MIRKMKNIMGGGGGRFHMLQVILLSIFLFTFSVNAQALVGGSSMNNAEDSDESGSKMLDLMEYNGVKQVSGEEEIEERRAQVLDKFRILLGLKSFNIGKPKNGDFDENEFLAPSPAPSVKNLASALAPAPMAHTHVHPLMVKSRPIPLQPEIQRSHGNQNRVRRIVIAVAVSGGVAFVVCALGFTLLCQKLRRGRKKRFSRTASTNSSDIRFRRSKCLNSQNSVRKKVTFDLGPEHFLLKTSEPVAESNVSSHPNYTCESLETLSKQNQADSSLDLGIESGSEPKNYADCRVEEEIISVHEAEEPKNSESDGSNGSLGNKIVPIESLSSDDESFHSFCDSNSLNLRISDASKEDLNDTSATLSPTICSNLPPSDPSHTQPCPSSLMKSPSLTTEADPRTDANSNLSPSSHDEKLTTSTSRSSSFTTKHVPPPPPPLPPPTLNFLPPLYSSHATGVIQKSSHSSTISNVSSSPRNSYSSTGSNTTPSYDFPSPPLLEPQAVAATNLATGATIIPPPPPPSPPLPPILPPAFIKGNTRTLQPPPPPPGLFSQQNLVGKDGTPLPKLKPLHWDKVRATPDRSMVWDKLKSSSFEFDEKMIESLFGYNLQIKHDEAKSKSPSPSKHILEPKRLQNITILSKALNATPEEVCEALIQGDGLCLQQLEALVKMAPTNEEEAKLSNYGGDKSELSSAEKFVKAILNVPFAFPRIEAMLYRDTFEDEVFHLRKSFAMLEEACKELRWSQLFLKLLEAVLKTGNRMNVGTIRGGARAFKLDALLKLADVKGTDGKTTLLHFVVQEMIRLEGIREAESITERKNQKTTKTVEEREDHYRKMGLDLVSGLSTELCNVKKTATIDLDVLASSVSNLSDGMAKLKHLIDEDLSMDGGKGNFINSMRSFLSFAEKNIKELKKDEDRVLLHVREITEYFHGDVSKDEANPLRIFVIVRDFLGMLDKVCKELRASKTSNLPIQVSPFR